MVKLVLIDPLKEPRWDQFVLSHPFGWVCHLSAWKTVLERCFKHISGHFLALEAEPKGPLLAAMPVYEVRSWLTGRRLISIPFATLSDPLISSAEEFFSLLQATKELANTLNIKRIEIRTNQSSELLSTTQIDMNSPYRCHVLHLTPDLDRLKRNFHRTCVRQRISRALKSRLELVTAKNESDLRDFYRLHFLTRKRLALPPQPFQFFQSIWEMLSRNNTLSILLAKSDGVPVAGLMLFRFRKRMSAEALALDMRFRAASPAHFLFWHAIRLASESGYKIFDFGRTHVDNVDLMDFKRRWGTDILDLATYHFPNDPAGKSITEPSSLKYRLICGLCKNSPDFVLEQIGKLSYRHLG